MLFINIRIQWLCFFCPLLWKNLWMFYAVNSTRKTFFFPSSAITHSSGHFLTAASCCWKVTPFVFVFFSPGQGSESSLWGPRRLQLTVLAYTTEIKGSDIQFLYLDFYTQIVYYIFFFSFEAQSNKDQIEPMMLPIVPVICIIIFL